MPCHDQVDYDEPNWQSQLPHVDLCAGMLIHFRNWEKMPRRPQIAEAVRAVKKNPLVFRNPIEFFRHHMRHATDEQIVETVRRATLLPGVPPEDVT